VKKIVIRSTKKVIFSGKMKYAALFYRCMLVECARRNGFSVILESETDLELLSERMKCSKM